MLVLSRKQGQEILIGDDIRVTVIKVQGNRVKIAIHAPDHCRILRGELQAEASAPVTDTAPHFATGNSAWLQSLSAAQC